MTRYQRVTEANRYQIEAWLKSQVSVVTMAKWLGFHKTSVYREIARNGRNQGYQADRAQVFARRRLSHCRRKSKMEELEQAILSKLQEDWSPEQIQIRFVQERVPALSFSTIYRYIRKKRKHLKVYLRSYNKRGAGRLRQRRRIRAYGLSIHERPLEACHRITLGHWERDTMYIGERRQVLVLTDRKSRYTRIVPLAHVDTQSVARQTQNLLESMPCKTLTNDNGPEFRFRKPIGVPVYFCEPRKPQQRGTIENTIGLLRQYLKRKTSLDELTHSKIKWIEDRINLRPRKCLDFNTPYEIFFNKKVALAMTT